MNVAIRPFTVDLPTAAAIVGLSESTWQALVRAGKAPKPRQLSDRRVGWRVADLEAWVDSRPESDLPPPANTGAQKAKNAGNNAPPQAVAVD